MQNDDLIIRASAEDSELIGFTAAPDLESARKIARALIEEKLAACVQIGAPVESFYEWGGKFCNTPEIPLTIKLLSSNEKKLFEKLKSVHSYECPEWISVRAESISASYAKWMRNK